MNRLNLGVTPCYTGSPPPLLKIEGVKRTNGTESKVPLEEKTETTANESKVESSVEPTMDSAAESVTDPVEKAVEEIGGKPLKEEVQPPSEGEEKIVERSPKDSDRMSEEISMRKILPPVKMKSLRKMSNFFSFVYCEVGPDWMFDG